MLVYEYKVDGSKKQYAAIDEAIRIVQFIRNKCLRKWMDERGVSRNDLQTYCAVLADEYPFASYLNSQARQTSADRAWFAISRFYENCKTQKPGKKKKSHNRQKARKRLAKAYLKVSRQREDFARKQANALVSSCDLIAYEDLQIANLVKNHHVAKSLHDAAWGQFLTWVNRYGSLHDITIVAVSSQFTSQYCSACGTLVKKSLSMRTHSCETCGSVMDRDHNAARNILQKAHGTVGQTATHGSSP